MSEDVKLDSRGYPFRSPTRGQRARVPPTTILLCRFCDAPIVLVSPPANLRRRKAVSLSSWLSFPSRFLSEGHQIHWHRAMKVNNVPK